LVISAKEETFYPVSVIGQLATSCKNY